MSRRPPSVFDLAANMMRLGIEAQGVIALRMMKFAAGGAGVESEFSRMFAEKALAVVDAQIEASLSALTGQPHLVPARTVALYRRRVRANHRRLIREG
jgi:hypothetical protein